MPRRTPHRTNRTYKTNRPHSSHPEGFTPPHGGYENLLSFQKARIVYDGTVRFCERFLKRSYETYFETRPPEVVANILLCLIHQTNYLLDQQIRALEKAFLEEGGLRERMTRTRLKARRSRQKSKGNFVGSSIHRFTVTRNVAASFPSTARWS